MVPNANKDQILLNKCAKYASSLEIINHIELEPDTATLSNKYKK